MKRRRTTSQVASAVRGARPLVELLNAVGGSIVHPIGCCTLRHAIPSAEPGEDIFFPCRQASRVSQDAATR